MTPTHDTTEPPRAPEGKPGPDADNQGVSSPDPAEGADDAPAGGADSPQR